MCEIENRENDLHGFVDAYAAFYPSIHGWLGGTWYKPLTP